MSARRWLRGLSLWFVASGVGLACGNSGVVGGDCADGYVECNGRCVDISSDARHCGACNRTCEFGDSCRVGQCSDAVGGASGAAGADGSSTSNGSGGGGVSSTGGSGGMGGSGPGGSGGSGGGGGSGMGGVAGSGGSGPGGSGGSGGSTGSGGSGTGGSGTGGSGTGGSGTGGSGTGGSTGSGGSGTGGSGGSGGGSGGSSGSGGSAGTGGVSGSGGTGGTTCLPPYDTPSQCGDCDTQCALPTPLCAPAMGGGHECVPLCGGGLTQCSGQCVDLQTHPKHCGSCGNVCASGVCADGACLGATAGHSVYMCMDYAQAFQSSAQTTLLGNAVFLPRREPVRVMAYSEHAVNAVMNSTDRTIRWAGSSLNRTVEITRVGSVAEIESGLSLTDFDVLLVYDQPAAPAGALAAAGTQLSGVLADFTDAGGVAIVMSSGTGVAEMGSFATSAGLMQIGAETDHTDELAYNHASGDVIGFGVVTPFRTLPTSCSFVTSETPSLDTVFVITDSAGGSGAPIVLHKIVNP